MTRKKTNIEKYERYVFRKNLILGILFALVFFEMISSLIASGYVHHKSIKIQSKEKKIEAIQSKIDYYSQTVNELTLLDKNNSDFMTSHGYSYSNCSVTIISPQTNNQTSHENNRNNNQQNSQNENQDNESENNND